MNDKGKSLMKRLLQASALVAILPLAGGVCAQDIQVTSPTHTDMSSTPDITPINSNDYGSVFTSVDKTYAFTVFNHDPDTHLTLGDVGMTGANANQFQSIVSYTHDLGPFQQTTIYLRCNTDSVGVKNATVNIPNNDPDLGGTFSFPVRGTGVVAALFQPDLSVSYGGMPTLKLVKQSNSDYIVAGAFYIENKSTQIVENTVINVYGSFDRMYQDSDPMYATFIIPKLAAAKEGKPPKQKRVKFSFQFTFNEAANFPRYVFIEALPPQGDSYTGNNRVRIHAVDPIEL
jgi:hypothetical protein